MIAYVLERFNHEKHETTRNFCGGLGSAYALFYDRIIFTTESCLSAWGCYKMIFLDAYLGRGLVSVVLAL